MAVSFRSSTSVVHVCNFASSSAVIIGAHSALLALMLPPASENDVSRLVAVVTADVSEVQALVRLPFGSKAAAIAWADAVSGTSTLENEAIEVCGTQSQHNTTQVL